MLNKEEQLSQLVKSHAQKILITKDEINGDLFGSLLAWGIFIGKYTKKDYPALYIPRYGKLKKIYNFLPEYPFVLSEISGVRDFILSFDTSYNDIENVRFEKKNGHLDIFITPQKGTINPKDFSFIPAKFSYDLLLTLGVSDFGDLGKAYEANSDLFFELPIINIDISQGNDNYGQLNIVNPMPSSLAEFSADLMLKIDESLVRDEIAKCLLTALVEATDNLKSSKVTPHTFDIAATLMERGGDHQEIITALYDTESLASLKLWGELLKRLKEGDRIIWSYLKKEDLFGFEAPEIMLRRFFIRLKNYISLSGKKLVVFWEEDQKEKNNVFLFKVNKDLEEDQILIGKTEGELINREILHFSLEKEKSLEDFAEKIESML